MNPGKFTSFCQMLFQNAQAFNNTVPNLLDLTKPYDLSFKLAWHTGKVLLI